jgi:acyl dehydratase
MNSELLAALDAQLGMPIKVFPWVTRASLDAIRHFALGLGDDNPLWWDDTSAPADGRGRMHAPPTFLYAAMSGGPWPEGEEDEADHLPPTVVLWSGDRWVWHDPPSLDEPLQVDGEVVEVSRREPRAAGGSRAGVGSVAKTELTRFRGEGGRPLAELYRRRIIFERDSPELSRPDLSAPAASYTENDVRKIAAAYREEAERRRGPVPRYWEDVAVGEAIGPIVKGPLTTSNLIGWVMGCGFPLAPTNRIAARYLAQNPERKLVHEASGIPDTVGAAHWDADLAQQGGLARGYDIGSQRISWVAHLLTDWIGDAGALVELDARLRRANLIGDTTWLSGEVESKERTAAGAHISCRVTGTNQRGETTITATATVALPSRGGAAAVT